MNQHHSQEWQHISREKLVFKKSNLNSCIALGLCSCFISSNIFANEGEVPDAAIEKIIVTGQKISRTLQDTPASVAVFSTQKLEDQNIGEFSEVLFEAANVHSSAAGGFNIRGIDSLSVSAAGTGALASVYLDGAPLPSRLIQNGVSTWDASQVEVLRGPQSTLQGRNSLAGAVVMTTQTPSHNWNGKYRFQVGQHGEKEGAIALGGSLIEDQLAFRFSGEKEDFDGFNFNNTRNENADFRENDLYRIKLLYTPEALADFSALLTITTAESESGPTGVDVPDSGDPFDNRTIANNDPQLTINETNIVNLKLDYGINKDWDLSAISTYSEVLTKWSDYDDDNSPIDGGTRFFKEEDSTFTQEFRLTFDYDNLTGLIGAYYFKQDIPSLFGGTSRISLASAGVNAPFLQAQFGLDDATAAFVVAQYADFDPVLLEQQATSTQDISTYALFTDVTYQINDQWDIFVGLRWDREEQKNTDTQNFGVGNLEDMPNAANYPAPLQQLIAGINAQLIANVDVANQLIPLADASFNELVPKVGVSYHWNEDLTTSFILQEGYRSGGVGVNTAKATPFQFDPEFTTNYEISLRSAWLDGSLVANANFFYIDWQDQQVSVQLSENSFDSQVLNAGTSNIKGFEIELNYQLNSELTFYSSLGQAKSEFEEFTIVIPTAGESVIFDLSGRSFADAPEWTANAGLTYSADNGVFANLSINYADGSPADTNPFNRGLNAGDDGFDLQNEGRTLVNMQVGYEWESVGIYLVGKNILEEEYIAGAAFGSGRRVVRHDLGAPRQLSLSLRGTF
jgi:iron complex outermembrane receptor protein